MSQEEPIPSTSGGGSYSSDNMATPENQDEVEFYIPDESNIPEEPHISDEPNIMQSTSAVSEMQLLGASKCGEKNDFHYYNSQRSSEIVNWPPQAVEEIKKNKKIISHLLAIINIKLDQSDGKNNTTVSDGLSRLRDSVSEEVEMNPTGDCSTRTVQDGPDDEMVPPPKKLCKSEGGAFSEKEEIDQLRKQLEEKAEEFQKYLVVESKKDLEYGKIISRNKLLNKLVRRYKEKFQDLRSGAQEKDKTINSLRSKLEDRVEENEKRLIEISRQHDEIKRLCIQIKRWKQKAEDLEKKIRDLEEEKKSSNKGAAIAINAVVENVLQPNMDIPKAS